MRRVQTVKSVSGARLKRVVVVVPLLLVTLGLAGSTCPRTGTRPGPGVGPTLFVMPGRPLCEGTGAAAVDVAVVSEPALREVSGAASSFLNADVLWMVADAGNPAAVHAVSSTTGAVRLTVALPIENVDWEDAALGPCPDLSGPCVFVADTGDNDRDRERVVVYVFPEPLLDETTPTGTVTLEAFWRLPLQFPDGDSVDVEALAVMPDASALLLFEKTNDRRARVFAARAPWQPESQNDATPQRLEETGRIAVPVDDAAPDDDRRITGASLHWSGSRLAVRFTGGIVEYESEFAAGFLDPETVTQRQVLPSPDGEEQGESITWSADGLSLFTIGEADPDGADSPVLHRIGCAP